MDRRESASRHEDSARGATASMRDHLTATRTGIDAIVVAIIVATVVAFIVAIDVVSVVVTIVAIIVAFIVAFVIVFVVAIDVAFDVAFIAAIVVVLVVAIDVGDRRRVRSHSMSVVECDCEHFASIVARGRRATSPALVETLARSLVDDARARARKSAMRCNPHEHWAAATRTQRAECASRVSRALDALHRCLWKPVFMPCCGSRPRKKKCTCTRNTCIM